MKVNIAKLNTFCEEYERQLVNAVTKYPDEYRYPPGDVPAVVDKMRAAIVRESYNKEGRAIKGTCKALGIPYTYKGIREYLTEEV